MEVFSILGYLFAGLLGLIFLRLTICKKKKKDWSKSGQLPWPRIKAQAPGHGAPLLAGVRVVEISSVAAAPSCARIFADLGAEVIKVEGPENCDMMRDNLLAFLGSDRKARRVSILFEGLNPGKASVIIDLKKNRADFINMLKDADVLITNMRVHQIRALNLDYDQIKDELPHLVVGQLNAWGREGPDSTLPGFDITAFWCASGLSHDTYSPKEFMYSLYPTAFGDITTGMGLFAGIVCALAERLTTKKGRLVTTSLFRQGVFANALNLCASDATLNPTKRMLEHGVPDYASSRRARSPAIDVYESSDRKYFSLVASPDQADSASAALANALDCDNSTEAVAAALSSMPFEDISKAMRELEIPVVVKTDASISPAEDPRLKNCFQSFTDDPSPPSDCPQVCKIPFTFSCSDQHGPRYQAPTLGCHTQAYKQTGWTQRADDQASSALVDARDVVVVELSEARSSCVAAGTLQFAKHVHACRLIRILTGPSYWAESNPKFERLLCEGKETLNCDIQAVHGELVRIAEEGASIIFVTNERVTLLREHGLDYDSLKAAIPSIAVVLVTPFDDVTESEEVRGEMGGYTLASPIAEFFSGIRAAPARLPGQMGELCTSTSVMGALASAHFHRLRTGEGQQVNMSLQSAAVWSAGFLIPICFNKPIWELFRQLNTTDTQPLVEWDWMNAQAPLFANYKTKDGAFVCVTPTNPPRLIKHAKAMGILAKILCTIVGTVVKDKLSGVDSFVAIMKALAKTNVGWRNFVESKTLKEFQEFTKKKDVWWGPVLTPTELLQSQVVRSANAIAGTGQDWHIQCPVQIQNKAR